MQRSNEVYITPQNVAHRNMCVYAITIDTFLYINKNIGWWRELYDKV